ncbi:hypothetical protein HK101_010681 [Irineochytrium annulatum]|nr:hypothetical protein HK101_010681 [Irineochytrium annulatum]
MAPNSLTFSALATAILGLTQVVRPSPCSVFDKNNNLYIFGLLGDDYFAGNDVSAWSTPNWVYVYNIPNKSWTHRNTSGLDMSTLESIILDHDTTVLWAHTKSQIYSLGLVFDQGIPDPLNKWISQVPTPFGPSYTHPVIGSAHNHLYFYDVPGVPAGENVVFVIHYNQLVADPIAYSGPKFPASHGKCVQIYRPDDIVTAELIFIPDDGSGTYYSDTFQNKTYNLPAPPVNDPNANYGGGATYIVQVSQTGDSVSIAYMGFGAFGGNDSTKWTTIDASGLKQVAPLTTAVTPSTATSKSVVGTGVVTATQPVLPKTTRNLLTQANAAGSTVTSIWMLVSLVTLFVAVLLW